MRTLREKRDYEACELYMLDRSWGRGEATLSAEAPALPDAGTGGTPALPWYPAEPLPRLTR